MDKYYIKRFRYDDNHIYLDLYCYETSVNFEITFVNYHKIKQMYKDILKQVSLCCDQKRAIILPYLIKTLETRRKELNNEKS